MDKQQCIDYLPREIWLHQIIEYLHSLDLIFSLGRVSKVFRYELVNEYWKLLYMKKECSGKDENDHNYIDNYSIKKIKYMIRIELLKFIVKYELSMTKEGVFRKVKNQNSQTHSIINQNSSSTTNQKLNELLQSRMLIFDFYFSHFYRKLPMIANNQPTEPFSHKENIEPTPETSEKPRKFLVVGDGAVGKTTLCTSFNDDFVFDKGYNITIGVEVTSHRVNIGKDIEINFSLWDTAAPSKIGVGLRDGYYFNSSVCIVCFDRTNRYTYQSVAMWFRDIKRVEPDCEVIIVGSKHDMKNDIKVKPKQISFPLKKYCPYLSTSCLDGVNNRAVIWYAALIDHFVSNLKTIP